MSNQEFNEESTNHTEEFKTTEKHGLSGKMDAVGWGLFFIWIGIVFLLNVGTGVGLLGVGIITLGMQVVRKYFNLKLEKFWIVLGVLFLVGGLWELSKVQLPLVAILLIVAGLVIIVSVVKGKQMKE